MLGWVIGEHLIIRAVSADFFEMALELSLKQLVGVGQTNRKEGSPGELNKEGHCGMSKKLRLLWRSWSIKHKEMSGKKRGCKRKQVSHHEPWILCSKELKFCLRGSGRPLKHFSGESTVRLTFMKLSLVDVWRTGIPGPHNDLHQICFVLL